MTIKHEDTVMFRTFRTAVSRLRMSSYRLEELGRWARPVR